MTQTRIVRNLLQMGSVKGELVFLNFVLIDMLFDYETTITKSLGVIYTACSRGKVFS